jgi:hypothetical protein
VDIERSESAKADGENEAAAQAEEAALGEGDSGDSGVEPLEAQLSLSQEQKAVEALKEAEIVNASTGQEMSGLMARAFVKEGGVPARIVDASEGSARVPDLTANEAGREALRRLDEYVQQRLAALQKRRGEGDESPSPGPDP